MTRPQENVKVIRAPENTVGSVLYHGQDGYDFVFESTIHTKLDVIAPGFFDIFREKLLTGNVIECRLGKIEDGITQVWLQVIHSSKFDHKVAVLVSVGPSRKFTPVRHSEGVATDEKEAAPKTDATDEKEQAA